MVNRELGRFALTDLARTSLDGVRGRFFRLFVPVKIERMRLPTSLPEFWALRHRATLSDSPVTAAHHLGGHWAEYNLAAITHVAACNFRCSYCYVSYPHLAGRDSFSTSASEIADEFVRLRTELAGEGHPLSILRISGGEPLLAPLLVIGIYEELDRRSVLARCMLKVESNASALPYTISRLSAGELSALRAVAPRITLHVTIHAAPGGRDWPLIQDGLVAAADTGFDLYPAIGGADWTVDQLGACFDALAKIHPDLPLRLAVRPFNLDYPALRGRRNLPKPQPGGEEASLLWERILRTRLSVPYLIRPRHLIAIHT